MFCFNEFAFTVQVKHKINSTQILGLILICLYLTTGHFHTCVLCKECSRYLPFLILGSVFSDCVVFYGDILCYKSLLRHALHCVLSVLQRYRFIQFSSGDYRTITDRVSGEDNAIGHVRLFACLTLSFEQVIPAERR